MRTDGDRRGELRAELQRRREGPIKGLPDWRSRTSTWSTRRTTSKKPSRRSAAALPCPRRGAPRNAHHPGRPTESRARSERRRRRRALPPRRRPPDGDAEHRSPQYPTCEDRAQCGRPVKSPARSWTATASAPTPAATGNVPEQNAAESDDQRRERSRVRRRERFREADARVRHR